MNQKLHIRHIEKVLEERDLKKFPVLNNAQISKILSNTVTPVTVNVLLSKVRNDKTLKTQIRFAELGTKLFVYWLEGDFEKGKRKFRMNIGWE